MHGGTLIGPEELFFGAGFGHINRFSTEGGGTWPEPGELFFPELSHLTLMKARTPTARRSSRNNDSVDFQNNI